MPTPIPPPMKVVLRDSIRKTGRSLAAIARESGVDQSILTRFMNGADIRLTTACKLLPILHLRLTEVA